MDKNLNLAAEELFAKIRSQFSKVSMKDENGESTDEPKLARQFYFDFTKNNVPLGSIRVDLSQEDGLVIIFSNDIVDKQPDAVKTIWFNFIEELREFAKPKFLQFEVRNIKLDNMNKRGENQMNESKLWGGNRTSYQDLGETKLIIKHSQPINPDIPAGRTMHIESIYVENASGERFRYPVRHLNGARAMAEHIAHGGTPYDDIGQFVIGLSEELSSLRKFKSYVSRTSGVSEAMGDISNKVIERIDEIKKQITSLQKSSFYESFADSFTKFESTEIPEDIVNDWVDRLTIKTFNEELKGVFPYIYRLVGEEISPVKEVEFGDIINKLSNNESNISKKDEKSLPEEKKLEFHLNRILGEDGTIFSNNEQEQSIAIQKLNELISKEFPVGSDGTNAIESLQEIISDEELDDIFKELADISPTSDVRSILKDYITMKDNENGTDILGKLNFEGDSPDTADQAPNSTEAPSEPAAPQATVPPSMPVSPGVAMEENIKRVIEKAKKAGMTAEDKFTLFGEEISLADAIQKVGLDINEFFDNGYKDSGDEIVEFVRSMFDENGNTPKGPTGVLISVEKKFGEEAISKAKQVMNELMNRAEMRRIQELSGLNSTQEEGFGDELAYKAGSAVGKVQKGVRDTVSNIRKGVSDLATNFQAGQQAAQQDQLVRGQPSGMAGQPARPGDMDDMDDDPETSQQFPISRSALGQNKAQTQRKVPMQPGIGTQPARGQAGQPARPQREDSELVSMLKIAGLR